MLEPEVLERIRTIFLQPRPHVSIADATVLLGWTRGEMAEAVRAGEIEVEETSVDRWIWREELMAKALEIWPLEAIEEALDTDADRALPAAIRLTELRVRIPRHHVAMLEHFAERDRTTVCDVLTRELDGVASANADELSWAIAGFEAAMQWPDTDATQVPC
jgi:hypothetical protein